MFTHLGMGNCATEFYSARNNQNPDNICRGFVFLGGLPPLFRHEIKYVHSELNYCSQIIFANSIGETCRVVNTLANVPHDGQRGVPFAENCLLLLNVVASKPHFFAMPEHVILFSFANCSIAFHSIWCVTIFSFILFFVPVILRYIIADLNRTIK